MFKVVSCNISAHLYSYLPNTKFLQPFLLLDTVGKLGNCIVIPVDFFLVY